MKTIWLIILMLAFQLGQGITFNMGGVMSVGWILALGYTCLFLFNSSLFRIKDFRYISILYLLLFLFQILAEYMAGNSFNNGIKGVAVNVVSYASFFFLVNLLIKDQRLIVWAFIGIVLRMILFGKESDSTAEKALAGEDATFFKFYLGPIIVYWMLALSVFFKKKTFTYLFMYLGLFFVVAGARSLGLITFLIGSFVWFIRFKKKNVTVILKKYALVFIAMFYGLYCVYVSNVMNGAITAGNNTQLTNSENPYNPLEIIKYSRSDAWVAVNAFMDKPLWGHGSWSTDPGFKYHMMIAKLTNREFNNGAVMNLIPGHSVIFGRGAYNGIFVMFLTILIIYFFLKRSFLLLNNDSVYIFILMYCLYSLIWNSLFSPVGHFRDSFPLYFAFIYVCWFNERRQIVQNRVGE